MEKYYSVSSLFEQRHAIAAENLSESVGIETLQVLGLAPPTDIRNMRISAAKVDIDVSKHDVVKFFSQTTESVIVIWSCSYDQCDPTFQNHIVKKLNEALLSKEDGSTPKNLWYDYAEFAWVSYDVTDDCVFINHNQVNGIFKGEMKTKEEIMWYRYALSAIVEMLPSHYQIYVPTSALYNKMSNAQINANITSRPYSPDTMISSGFVISQVSEMLSNPNVAAKWSGPPKGLVWKYNR